MGDEDDPFDMSSAPPLSKSSFEAPPLTEEPASDLPSFGDVSEPPPSMPPMDMGGMDMGGGMGGLSADAFAAPPGGEMGPVAQWRMANREKVEAKAEKSRAEEQVKVAEAQSALQSFYAERDEKIKKRATENRNTEAQYVQERDAAMIADSWDSVCKLVDLKEKAGQEVDTSRMRSLLIQLKN